MKLQKSCLEENSFFIERENDNFTQSLWVKEENNVWKISSGGGWYVSSKDIFSNILGNKKFKTKEDAMRAGILLANKLKRELSKLGVEFLKTKITKR